MMTGTFAGRRLLQAVTCTFSNGRMQMASVAISIAAASKGHGHIVKWNEYPLSSRRAALSGNLKFLPNCPPANHIATAPLVCSLAWPSGEILKYAHANVFCGPATSQCMPLRSFSLTFGNPRVARATSEHGSVCGCSNARQEVGNCRRAAIIFSSAAGGGHMQWLKDHGRKHASLLR